MSTKSLDFPEKKTSFWINVEPSKWELENCHFKSIDKVVISIVAWWGNCRNGQIQKTIAKGHWFTTLPFFKNSNEFPVKLPNFVSFPNLAALLFLNCLFTIQLSVSLLLKSSVSVSVISVTGVTATGKNWKYSSAGIKTETNAADHKQNSKSSRAFGFGPGGPGNGYPYFQCSELWSNTNWAMISQKIIVFIVPSNVCFCHFSSLPLVVKTIRSTCLSLQSINQSQGQDPPHPSASPWIFKNARKKAASFFASHMHITKKGSSF